MRKLLQEPHPHPLKAAVLFLAQTFQDKLLGSALEANRHCILLGFLEFAQLLL